MIVQIVKITEEGIERKEYKAHGARYSGDTLAIDIEGIGWRAFELKDINICEIREA